MDVAVFGLAVLIAEGSSLFKCMPQLKHSLDVFYNISFFGIYTLLINKSELLSQPIKFIMILQFNLITS